MSPHKNEDRISELLKQVIRSSRSGFKHELILSDRKDDVTKLAIEFNKVIKKLQVAQESIRHDKQRMDKLLDTLVNYTAMDFSEKAPISEKGDELDAFAAGINALVEELNAHIIKIREGEVKFRSLVENVKDYAICMLDINGNITSWNRGAEHIKAIQKTRS